MTDRLWQWIRVRWWPDACVALVLALVLIHVTSLVLAVCWIPTVRALFIAKKEWPYAKVAEFLHTQMHKGDVIVAGWGIGFTLSQFFESADEQIMLPDKYLNTIDKHLDSPLLERVFYVTGRGAERGRTTPVRWFGQAEVTIYSGNTARALRDHCAEERHMAGN